MQLDDHPSDRHQFPTCGPLSSMRQRGDQQVLEFWLCVRVCVCVKGGGGGGGKGEEGGSVCECISNVMVSCSVS